MYQGFRIIDVIPNYVDGIVTINASFDIDPDTVDDTTIQLFSKFHKTDANLEFVVKDKTITVLVKDEIVPNTDYILRVAGVKNIIGDDLDLGIRKTLTFRTAVREIPVILSPSHYEEITDLKVTLKAILEDEEYDVLEDKSYFIQVADDVAFINVILETSTVESTVDLKAFTPGQYFIRARVEAIEDGVKDYGKWSKTATFISVAKPEEDEIVPDDGPTFVNNIRLLSKPTNGETPESFIFEFSGELDPDSIDNIIVIRRDI